MSLTAVLRSFLPCFLPLTSTVSPGSKSSARLTVAPGRRRSGSPTLSIRSCRVSLIRSPLLDRRVRTSAPRTSVRERVPSRLAPHGSTHRDLASGPRSRGSTSASRSGTHRTTIRRLSHPYPQCSLSVPWARNGSTRSGEEVVDGDLDPSAHCCSCGCHVGRVVGQVHDVTACS